MLPIKRRVRKESFEKIIKDGFFIHANYFYLKALNRNDEKPSLFGFVVPNKIKKTSVGRHLIKRKMSAVVEKFLLKVRLGFSCVFFLKKDIFTPSYKEIEKEILELLKKAKILNEKGF